MPTFDREYLQAQRIKSRSHRRRQRMDDANNAFFADIASGLTGTNEALLASPGLARNQFRKWCSHHQTAVAATAGNSVVADHPSDAPMTTLARQYLKKFDGRAGNP